MPLAIPISAQEIHNALTLVLRSAPFAKAPRISQLLRFLVTRIPAGEVCNLNANAIAAEVFGRNADSFDPTIDPIVRVQLGRLRDKLKRYYASPDCDASLRFDIPIGTCVPKVTWRVSQPLAPQNLTGLQFIAVKPFGGIDGRSFCRGFNEQLLHDLFRICGARITVHIAPTQPSQRRLEGSLRVEAGDLRVSMRLIDNNSGRLLWVHQHDYRFEPSIRQQEQMAEEICTALLPQL